MTRMPTAARRPRAQVRASQSGPQLPSLCALPSLVIAGQNATYPLPLTDGRVSSGPAATGFPPGRNPMKSRHSDSLRVQECHDTVPLGPLNFLGLASPGCRDGPARLWPGRGERSEAPTGLMELEAGYCGARSLASVQGRWPSSPSTTGLSGAGAAVVCPDGHRPAIACGCDCARLWLRAGRDSRRARRRGPTGAPIPARSTVLPGRCTLRCRIRRRARPASRW
jgi:hypothetical protein